MTYFPVQAAIVLVAMTVVGAIPPKLMSTCRTVGGDSDKSSNSTRNAALTMAMSSSRRCACLYAQKNSLCKTLTLMIRLDHIAFQSFEN